MTNAIALFLGLVIVAAVGTDLWFGGGVLLFLSREFADLVQWVAFWR